MNLATTSNPASTSAQGLGGMHGLLGGSLARLASAAKANVGSAESAGVLVTDRLDLRTRKIQAAAAHLQSAISVVHAADSFLEGMTTAVRRMGELASLATDPETDDRAASCNAEFRALQEQLRATIGGERGEIGGRTGVRDPLGAYDGKPLFGPPGTLLESAGDSRSPELITASLRTGPMLALIRQNMAGEHALGASSPEAGATVAGAREQLGSVRAALGSTRSRLEIAAAGLQIESQNVSAAVVGLDDPTAAHTSTAAARHKIATRADQALIAQANQAPQSVLKLLQRP